MHEVSYYVERIKDFRNQAVVQRFANLSTVFGVILSISLAIIAIHTIMYNIIAVTIIPMVIIFVVAIWYFIEAALLFFGLKRNYRWLVGVIAALNVISYTILVLLLGVGIVVLTKTVYENVETGEKFITAIFEILNLATFVVPYLGLSEMISIALSYTIFFVFVIIGVILHVQFARYSFLSLKEVFQYYPPQLIYSDGITIRHYDEDTDLKAVFKILTQHYKDSIHSSDNPKHTARSLWEDTFISVNMERQVRVMTQQEQVIGYVVDKTHRKLDTWELDSLRMQDNFKHNFQIHLRFLEDLVQRRSNSPKQKQVLKLLHVDTDFLEFLPSQEWTVEETRAILSSEGRVNATVSYER